jgi:hypothetical protein
VDPSWSLHEQRILLDFSLSSQAFKVWKAMVSTNGKADSCLYLAALLMGDLAMMLVTGILLQLQTGVKSNRSVMMREKR